MKVMITGAAGFIGGFLAQRCSNAGCSILGLDINAAPDLWSTGSFEICDVRDEVLLRELIAGFRPDCIFHLAAQSYPTVSLVEAYRTMDVNAGGTINLYESLRKLQLRPTVVVACSSAEYGPVTPESLPVKETHSLNPLHPYGVSKVAQDLLAAQYFINYSIPSVRIRIFNTTGPGKVGDVCSDLAKRTIEIELGIKPNRMIVGNLMTRRALIDVRDMVEALWKSPGVCEAGEVYNIGGEQIYSVQEIVDTLRQLVTITFAVEQVPELMRPADEPIIAGDISKFRQCSGWVPRVDLKKTLEDMLDWWRVRLSSKQIRVVTQSHAAASH